VGLRGRVLPVAAGQPHGPGTAGQRDTVRVLFEPPVLSLGDNLHFRIGEQTAAGPHNWLCMCPVQFVECRAVLHSAV
jgi:hypothetical protein